MEGLILIMEIFVRDQIENKIIEDQNEKKLIYERPN